MDPLVIVLTVVAAILSLILIVVGVQTIMVLQEIRKTLHRFNQVADTVESAVNKAFVPLQNLGGMMSGMKMGMKMFEAFAGFLQRSSVSDRMERAESDEI